MQRWLSSLLGIVVVVVAVLLAAKGLAVRPRAGSFDGGSSETPPAASDGGTPNDPSSTSASSTEARAGSGSHSPDGTQAPPLPDRAPGRVRFGVVLVTYAGAQGAPDRARSQKDALEIANKLTSDARSDFHAAVVRGDNGSIDDAGSLPRGVLEPALEFALFTLPVGGVSEPLDTPRGYWIVKRIE